MRYFLFIILSFVVAAGYSASRLTDLREQAYLFPQVALRQIDSLQQKAQYPSYQLEYIRSCAYFRLSMFGRALDSAEKAYHSVEIKSDTVLYRRISMILAEASVFAFSLDKATRYIRKGKEYATSISDHVMLAGMLLSEGYLYRRLSLSKKAYECAFRAEKLLEGGKSETEIYYLSHTYGFLMMYYISDRKYAEAWQIGLERSKLLSRLPELRRDNQSGYLYSKVAFLAHMLGKEFEDEKYYELFLGTHFSKTLVGRLEINDYLLTMKNYDQVIVNAQAYVREMDRRDTLNISYERLLQQACVAYEAVGDYRKAYAVAKRRMSIQQAIRLNNERNYLLENTDLFNALAAREELEETEEKLRTDYLARCAGGSIAAVAAGAGGLHAERWEDAYSDCGAGEAEGAAPVSAEKGTICRKENSRYRQTGGKGCGRGSGAGSAGSTQKGGVFALFERGIVCPFRQEGASGETLPRLQSGARPVCAYHGSGQEPFCRCAERVWQHQSGCLPEQPEAGICHRAVSRESRMAY